VFLINWTPAFAGVTGLMFLFVFAVCFVVAITNLRRQLHLLIIANTASSRANKRRQLFISQPETAEFLRHRFCDTD